jgi:hypothetical protein
MHTDTYVCVYMNLRRLFNVATYLKYMLCAYAACVTIPDKWGYVVLCMISSFLACPTGE